MNPLERLRLRRRVATVPFWFHSIDLDGVVTPGIAESQALADELDSLRLPGLAGRSVLDVGAWDGYYSFAAERAGAERVTALDHWAWSVDLAAWRSYLAGCEASGETARQAEELAEIWRPVELPGKQGFDLARETLDSRVEPLVGDFMEMELAPLGSFDVVLFLGVLYHLKEPLRALQRLASLTGELAVIESEAEVLPGGEELPLCRFLEGSERGADPTNWWSPSAAALLAMCRAAGFSRTELISGPESAAPATDDGPRRYRAVVHAWK